MRILSVPSIQKCLLASVLVALASTASAQVVCMRADLDGLQEVPPNPSTATGTAYVLVDRATNTASYSITFTGLSAPENNAHFHAGPVGVSGGVKVGLPLGANKVGSFVYAEADEATLINGGWYINIHSNNFGSGEIRGQVLRSDSLAFMRADLDGAQETPPNASTAKGSAYLMIDTVADSLFYSLTFDGLSAVEINAHIHAGAVGVAGPVKLGLPTGNSKSGTLSYAAADEATLLGGGWYFNVHSGNFPGGEIRGQIVAGGTNPSAYCVGKTNSKGCVPSVGFTGLPILSGADTFTLSATQCINNKNGIFFWGTVPSAAPFLGGTLCIKPPLKRLPPQSSGGNPPPNDCSGTYSFFFSHAYMASQGIGAGSQVHGQFWMRDPSHPDGTGVGLSNALYFAILP
ncbi:MAG: CHRD domain-containing protein [Planctomycetes bacterium]|nr:CHRD domain-containing protein [Planctomycetota bacterium]